MKRTAFAHRCSFEALENRRLMAGDVFAQMVHGNLVITGDNASNAIEISAGLNPGEVVVKGVNDGDGIATRVNALPSVTFGGFTGQLQLNMLNGNDKVTATTLTSAGFSFDLGKGNDTLNFTNQTINGSVFIRGGDGDEVVSFQNANVNGSLTVDLAKGTNTLTFDAVHVSVDAAFSAGSGNDTFTIKNETIVGNATVYMGKGNNKVDLLQGVGGALTMQGLSGDDIFKFEPPAASPPTRSLNVNLSSGFNDLTLNKIDVSRPSTISSGAGNDTFSSTDAKYGDILASFGKGTNTFKFNSATVSGNLAFSGGSGNDNGDMNASNVAGTFAVSLGNGANTLNVKNGNVQGDVTILGGKNADAVLLVNNHFFRALNVNLGNGINNLDVSLLTVDTVSTKALFRGGTGIDLFVIDQSKFAAVDIVLDNGNDTLKVTGDTSTQLTRFDGGGGIDTLTGPIPNGFNSPVVTNFEIFNP